MDARLTDLLASLAASVVDTQRLYDRAFEEDAGRYLAQARRGQADVHQLLAPVPRRTLVASQEFECRVALGVERSAGVQVGVTPIGLGYQSRYASSSARDSMLRFQVEQTPVQLDPIPEPDEPTRAE